MALNEVVEYIESLPRVEVVEKPLQVITYPLPVLVGVPLPVAVFVNSWGPESDVTVTTTAAHWHRGDRAGVINVTSIGGISSGDERRLAFLVVGIGGR